MKKLTIKLSYHEAVAMSGWAEWIIIRGKQPVTFADKCLWATIQDWYNTKLNPLTYYQYPDKKALKLNPQTATAIAHFISTHPVPVTDYIGNRLNQLLGEVDKTFK